MNEETKSLKIRKISFDGLMLWEDVQQVVGLSRPTVWRLERTGQFPARVQTSPGRICWHGNEIKAWIDSRPRVNPAQSEEAGVL